MDPEDALQAEFVCQIARHQASLHAFIISLMPGVDGVDDVLQETNMVLWQKRETYEPGTDFRAWACTIARFKAMAHRRRVAKLGVRSFEDDLLELLATESEAGPDELEEKLRALEKCLGRLDEPERGLIEHRYYTATGLEDFSAKCGRPVESLRVSLFRIRAALRKCISGEIAIAHLRS
ncbi:sigma-70 family RNA polymerase sigma factor [Luteolibacter flavescens]|uniref:Sigma-70 family RNA polymerase sigma factor n=1 Tax=Luteolibacter flavescens TaxID=1859460 RepID=A0ABT3FRL7_9BACT|nr:sigma-70 family RNA polymerase sigma factor [Luteolibacter flavescens]MCW1886187.1 sigma-70 family RNA polymerase sigma factor [Luteolibacter flavescens]